MSTGGTSAGPVVRSTVVAVDMAVVVQARSESYKNEYVDRQFEREVRYIIIHKVTSKRTSTYRYRISDTYLHTECSDCGTCRNRYRSVPRTCPSSIHCVRDIVCIARLHDDGDELML